MPVRIPPLHSTLLRRGPSGRTRPATAEAPAELVTLATTTLAYVTNYEDGTVSVIDTATNTVIATVPVGNNPYFLATTPDGTTAYVANLTENTVSVIDTATDTVTTTITVGTGPTGVAFSPDGTTAYVVNAGDNNVSVIDTATNTVTTTIDVGTGPSRVAVSPDGATAYVTNSLDDTVSVIDTATNTVTTTIAVDLYPNDVAVAVVPVASTVTVTATPNPAQVHQPVTLTAHVTCTGHTPTGTVRFYDGTTLLGTRTLNAAGTTTLTTSNLNAGTHQITAVYSGDATCPPAVSPPLTLTITKGLSTVRVLAIPNPALALIPVTLTARITCGADIPTGTVRFLDGTTTLGVVPVLAGTAILITSFRTRGTHQITAVYSGDTDCEAATSPPLPVRVISLF